MLDLFRNEPEIVSIPTGGYLFREGDSPVTSMYAILEGEVVIERAGREIARVAEGEIVGEMALIDDRPRSASARAVKDVRVAVVPEKRFLFLVQQHPSFSLEMMRMLTHRLRANLES